MSRVILSSLSNPSVRHLVRMRDNRARRRERRVLVDGWRETLRAFEAGLRPRGVYVTEGDERVDAEEQDMRAALSDHIQFVTDAVMRKISYGQSPRGVVAEFESPEWDLARLPLSDAALVLVLDRLEKPGNIGAAFRTADAAGVDAVVLTPGTTDRFNPNAVRGSLGAVFTVPSAATEELEAKRWLSENRIQILAARVESSRPIWDVDLTVPTAIVVGSEAEGLQTRWQSDAQSVIGGVHLPMSGRVDSLNVSTSAAVLLYEARRQRSAVTNRAGA